MKTLSIRMALAGGLLAAQLTPASAQDARFFRIVGPVPSTITSVAADGTITWTNQPTNATFTVQTAAALPAGWVDYVQVPASNAVTTHRIFDLNPPAGMAFIPAGSFTMGNCMDTNEGYSDELPLHTVYVSAFYMDQYDVTEALWAQVYNWATTHGYSFDHPGSVYGGYPKGPNYPVVEVNWYDCVKWCNARSEMEGRTPAYYTDASQTLVYRTGDLDLSNSWVNWNAGYRLPTEAEWEKAARGGLSGHRFPWGDTISETQANYYSSNWNGSVPDSSYDVNSYSRFNTNFNTGNYPYTSPVNYFAPNGYGLYDMAGNVWQWCWDWHNDYWYGQAGATVNDTRGPGLSPFYRSRVLRGGVWVLDARYSRCAVRYADGPVYTQYYYYGFRCVRRL